MLALGTYKLTNRLAVCHGDRQSTKNSNNDLVTRPTTKNSSSGIIIIFFLYILRSTTYYFITSKYVGCLEGQHATQVVFGWEDLQLHRLCC
jgi:hypothetical protein